MRSNVARNRSDDNLYDDNQLIVRLVAGVGSVLRWPLIRAFLLRLNVTSAIVAFAFALGRALGKRNENTARRAPLRARRSAMEKVASSQLASAPLLDAMRVAHPAHFLTR